MLEKLGFHGTAMKSDRMILQRSRSLRHFDFLKTGILGSMLSTSEGALKACKKRSLEKGEESIKPKARRASLGTRVLVNSEEDPFVDSSTHSEASDSNDQLMQEPAATSPSISSTEAAGKPDSEDSDTVMGCPGASILLEEMRAGRYAGDPAQQSTESTVMAYNDYRASLRPSPDSEMDVNEGGAADRNTSLAPSIMSYETSSERLGRLVPSDFSVPEPARLYQDARGLPEYLANVDLGDSSRGELEG
jgi:hypothetical protein